MTLWLFLVGSAIAQVSQIEPPKNHFKRYVWENILYQAGIVLNDTISDQTAMNAFISDTSNHYVFCPPGILRGNINVNRSNLTMELSDGFIVDGVFHIGVGPSVDNPIGNLHYKGPVRATVRIGAYFVDGLYAPDGLFLTDTNSTLYREQVLQGGPTGIHIYQGTKNAFFGPTRIENTVAGQYALSVDIAGVDSSRYWPENIEFTSVTVGPKSVESALRAARTRGLRIGHFDVMGWGTRNAVHMYGCVGTEIRSWEIRDSTGKVNSGLKAFYIEADTLGRYGIGRIEAGTSNIYGAQIVNCYRTEFGDVTVRCEDTTGSYFGFDLEGGRDIGVGMLRVRGWNQGLRIINNKFPRISFLWADSNNAGMTVGGTTDSLLTLQYFFRGNTSGTDPTLLVPTIFGPLPSLGNPVAGIKISGYGIQGDLSADSLQPQDVTTGILKLLSVSGNQAQGPAILLGNTLFGVERYYAAIKGAPYTSADSAQGLLNILIRLTQTDSTLKRVLSISQIGNVRIGFDNSTDIILAHTRPTDTTRVKVVDVDGQERLETVGAVVTAGGGGGGGGGDDIQVSDTGNNLIDLTTAILKSSGSAGFVRVGATDSVYVIVVQVGRNNFDSTNYAYKMDSLITNMMMTALIKTRLDSLTLIADSIYAISVTSGDVILVVTENGDTTKLLTGDNGVMMVGGPGMAHADSIETRQAIFIDTVDGSHTITIRVGDLSSNFIWSLPTSLGAGIRTLRINQATGVMSWDSIATGGGGGTSTRFLADSGNGEQPLPDTNIIVGDPGTGSIVDYENQDDTGTVFVRNDTTIVATRNYADAAAAAVALDSSGFVHTGGDVSAADATFVWPDNRHTGFDYVQGDTAAFSLFSGDSANVAEIHGPTAGYIRLNDSMLFNGLAYMGNSGTKTYRFGRTDGTDGQMMLNQGDSTGFASMSGDGTLSATGVLTLAANSSGSNEITDNSLVNADINASAAIAYSKLNLTTSIVTGDLASVLGTGAVVLLSALTQTVTDSLANYPTPKVEKPTVFVAPTHTPYGTAVSFDSSWWSSWPATRGSNTFAVYAADTATVFALLDSSATANDTIVHRFYYDVESDMYLDSLYITAISSDATILIDSIRVLGDSTNASTVRGTPDLFVAYTTNIANTSKTRTPIAMTGGNSWRVFKGGRVEILVWVTCSSADRWLGFVSVPTLAFRHRN